MTYQDKRIISAPLEVPVSSTNKFILNLNNYRNTHYHTLNKAKVIYKDFITDQILRLPRFNKIKLEFVLYPKTNRKVDIDNVCSIHSKFFSDALVELGRLPDDSYQYIVESTNKFGGVDKTNPRVDIGIIGIQ